MRRDIIHHRTLLISHFNTFNFSRINRAICYKRILHVHQQSHKQARTKSPPESLCRSSLHFDAIYEALLHADPITSILWYGLLSKFAKDSKWCQLNALDFPIAHYYFLLHRRNSSIAGKICVYDLREIFH